jgi:hypothetical protein
MPKQPVDDVTFLREPQSCDIDDTDGTGDPVQIARDLIGIALSGLIVVRPKNYVATLKARPVCVRGAGGSTACGGDNAWRP